MGEAIKISSGMNLYTAFDHYVLEKQIGQGGNGIVFSAVNEKGEKVAVKIVDKKRLEAFGKDKVKRFKNEIYFCMNHESPHIIKIIDYGALGSDYAFYVMPLGKETLRDRMKKGIVAQDALEICISLLKGISDAHRKNVFHRDIKPENILFMDEGNDAVIADFGIAHFSEDLYTIVETKKTDRLANFQYAAPEQREKGASVDGRADVFALGLILNEMYTGKLVAGNGYKKIADANVEYGFLDEIFEQLYCQDPEDRLYPVEKILVEINVLLQREKDNQKIQELKKVNVADSSGITLCNIPKLNAAEYINGALRFQLSEEMPLQWFDFLKSESYDHTYVMGYEPSKFNGQDNWIEVRLRCDESQSTLEDITKYFKMWLLHVTNGYNNELKREKAEKLRKQEAERLKEIEAREKELKMRAVISQLV